MADNLWSQLQHAKAMLRQLTEDVSELSAELVRQREDRLLDASEIERQRTEIQRLWADLAGVKEALREILADEDEDW